MKNEWKPSIHNYPDINDTSIWWILSFDTIEVTIYYINHIMMYSDDVKGSWNVFFENSQHLKSNIHHDNFKKIYDTKRLADVDEYKRVVEAFLIRFVKLQIFI